jgi:hypothetical protein
MTSRERVKLALNHQQPYKAPIELGSTNVTEIVACTDFGIQKGELISPDLFRKFYKPYFSKVND